MIDLHNHLLVNLDDGSRSLDRSVAVLETFHSHGVNGVICTPHLTASAVTGEGERHIAARDRALAELRAVSPGVELHAGFEIMLDEPLPPAAVADRRFALAESRYYLVEFPLAVPAELTTGILHRIVLGGVIPIVAHPERYGSCSVQTVRRWKEVGAAVQVDATTVTRATDRGRRARALLQAGVVDVLAADNHGDSRGLWTAVAWLTRTGETAAAASKVLARSNPGRVVDDRELLPVPPIGMRRSVTERLREWLT